MNLRKLVSLRPWDGALWCVTVRGLVVSQPMPLADAQRVRDYLARNGVLR